MSKIENTIRSYNPDWTVIISEFDKERFYFVVETKCKSYLKCAKNYFEALCEKVKFMVSESATQMNL